jgi:hypothetical protein
MKFLPAVLVCCAAFSSFVRAETGGAERGLGLWDAILRVHVAEGRVDYARLKTDPRLADYVRWLEQERPAGYGSREEKLAYWINAYNALTLKLVLAHHPVKSIRDIPHPRLKSPWDLPVTTIEGRELTLNQIEHEILRPVFKDARVHYAIVCAAVSCPPLRAEAYRPERLGAQLDEQGRLFLAKQNQFDPARRSARLSQIFNWFGSDFGADRPAVLTALAAHAPAEVAAALRAAPDRWTVDYLDYDWSLNDRR